VIKTFARETQCHGNFFFPLIWRIRVLKLSSGEHVDLTRTPQRRDMSAVIISFLPSHNHVLIYHHQLSGSRLASHAVNVQCRFAWKSCYSSAELVFIWLPSPLIGNVRSSLSWHHRMGHRRQFMDRLPWKCCILGKGLDLSAGKIWLKTHLCLRCDALKKQPI